MTIDKSYFRKFLGEDMLQVYQFPIFNGMPESVYKKLYEDLEPKIITLPNSIVYNCGDHPDSMYIVRQGQLIEEHELPQQKAVFCRYYRAG